MKRTSWNVAVDVLSFAAFVLLTSTGILVRYALPPGSGALHGPGTGRLAAQRPVTLLWGLTRHEWGAVHFWIAVVFLAVLALHLTLHWRWLACKLRGKPAEGSAMRMALGILGLVAVLALAVAPFVSPTEQVPRGELQSGGN